MKWVYSQIERKIEREILIGKEREIPQKMGERLLLTRAKAGDSVVMPKGKAAAGACLKLEAAYTLALGGRSGIDQSGGGRYLTSNFALTKFVLQRLQSKDGVAQCERSGKLYERQYARICGRAGSAATPPQRTAAVGMRLWVSIRGGGGRG